MRQTPDLRCKEMIGKRVFIALSLALIGLSFQQAQAQTFSSNGNSRRPKPAQAQEDFIDSHSTLQKSFDDFNIFKAIF